jgi:uncharacterized protein (DUF1499 family)
VKKAFTGILVISIFLVLSMFGLGIYSQTMQAPGLMYGQLTPCPSTPNCVSSESAPMDKHAIAAIELTPEMGQEPLLIIAKAVKATQGKIAHSDENYLSCTFKSDVFGFIDDLEFRIDSGRGLIHIRSASRVGYTDWNKNRERIKALKLKIKEMTTKMVA